MARDGPNRGKDMPYPNETITRDFKKWVKGINGPDFPMESQTIIFLAAQYRMTVPDTTRMRGWFAEYLLPYR